MSFLKEGLLPVEAVVGSMCEGQDGWVHQLPDPRVALLLAGTETQVGDLQEGKRLSSAATKAVWVERQGEKEKDRERDRQKHRQKHRYRETGIE
jgi:acylphosphatase